MMNQREKGQQSLEGLELKPRQLTISCKFIMYGK